MLGLLEVLGLNTPQPQVLVKKGKQTAEHFWGAPWSSLAAQKSNLVMMISSTYLFLAPTTVNNSFL